MHTGRRWYLVARDVRAAAWRTFRVDRMIEPEATGHRFTIDDPPDAVALVATGMAVAAYRIKARAHVDAPPAETARVVPRTVAVIEEADDGGTLLTLGGDSIEWIAHYLASLPFAFEALDPPELRALLRTLGARIAAAHT